MDEVLLFYPQGKQEQNTAKKEKRKDQRSGRRKKLAHSPNAATIKVCEWWWVSRCCANVSPV
jgi:hypothetical protein